MLIVAISVRALVALVVSVVHVFVNKWCVFVGVGGSVVADLGVVAVVAVIVVVVVVVIVVAVAVARCRCRCWW
eukprot:7133806-Alexandrium_andersonii.AAC.1